MIFKQRLWALCPIESYLALQWISIGQVGLELWEHIIAGSV